MKCKLKETNPHSIYIRVPIYNRNITVVFDKKSFDAINSTHANPLHPCHTQNGRTVEYGDDGAILVGCFNGKLETIVHELFHAAVFICCTAGVKFDADNDEAAAYLLEWLVGIIKTESLFVENVK